MDEIRLLIFRRGAEEYGVPVDDVIGIIGDKRVNRLVIPRCVEKMINLQGKPIPIQEMGTGLITGDNKLTLIIHSNGAEIAIIVDEVIKVTGVVNVSVSPMRGDGINKDRVRCKLYTSSSKSNQLA